MVIILAQWQVEGHEPPELKVETLYLHKREIPILPVRYHLLFGLGGSEIVAFLCIVQLFLEFSQRILLRSFMSGTYIFSHMKATTAGLHLKE